MGGAPNPEGGTAERATRAPAGPVMRFADAAKRLGAATRAAGLTVPAFRCPPRVPGARRTVRRYPGGAVVSVVLRDHTRMLGSPFALRRMPETPVEPSPNS